jgi:hypothetical protein
MVALPRDNDQRVCNFQAEHMRIALDTLKL